MNWYKEKTTKRERMTMKRLIRQTHISQPRAFVMKILGTKYPGTEELFRKSGLEGDWDPACAGKRLQLDAPMTWEVLLSQQGNTAQVWQELIDQNRLPFLAMIRNLRNLLCVGISPAHHIKLIAMLLDSHRVVASKILPAQFLAAYDAVGMDINVLGKMKKFLQKSLKALKRATGQDKELAKRGLLDEKTVQQNHKRRLAGLRSKVKALYGVPQVSFPQHLPTKKLLTDYRNAIDFGGCLLLILGNKEMEGLMLAFSLCSNEGVLQSQPGEDPRAYCHFVRYWIFDGQTCRQWLQGKEPKAVRGRAAPLAHDPGVLRQG